MFREISTALGFDEEGKLEQALEFYQKGVRLAEEALVVPLSALTQDDLRAKHEKLLSALNDAKSRSRYLSGELQG